MELYADKLCFVVYSPAIVLQTLLQNGKQTTTKKPVVNKRRQCESIRFAKVKEKKIERLRLSQGTKNSVSTPRLLKNRIKRGKGEKKKRKDNVRLKRLKRKKRFRISAIVKCVSPTFPYHEKTEKKASYKLSKQKKKKGRTSSSVLFLFRLFLLAFDGNTSGEKKKKTKESMRHELAWRRKAQMFLSFTCSSHKKKRGKTTKKKGLSVPEGTSNNYTINKQRINKEKRGTFVVGVSPRRAQEIKNREKLRR